MHNLVKKIQSKNSVVTDVILSCNSL